MTGRRMVRKKGLLRRRMFVLGGVAIRTVGLGMVVIHMTVDLGVVGSLHDRIHWVPGLERLRCMVCCFEACRVGRVRRVQQHQDLYRQQHPVEEVSSRGVQ